MEKITLTVKEVAKLLGVSTATVYTMVRQDQVPHFKVRGRVMFNREMFMAWTRGEVEAPNEVVNS